MNTESRELKVGDKVRIIKAGHAFDGVIGTITRVPNLPTNEYTVELPLAGWVGRTGEGWYKASEFEAIEPAETLDSEYCEWSDQVNQGFTAAETIAALRKELQQVWAINRDLTDRLYELEKENERLIKHLWYRAGVRWTG